MPDTTFEQIEFFIEHILMISTFFKTIPTDFAFERDPKDEKIINLALFSEADFIITRDKDLLDLMTDISVEAKEFRQKSRPLKIVEPIEFLDIIAKESLSLNP